METEEDIGAKFVATYYRLIFRCPQLLSKLYDIHAVIHREPPKQVFQLCLNHKIDLNPFNDKDTVVKILSYVSYPAGESLVVSVYGTLSEYSRNIPERLFTQQFMLKKVGNKYLIHNDIFYNFSAGQNIYMSQPDRTFNQEQTPLSMPIHAPPIAQMSPSSLPNTPQSYAFSPNPAPVVSMFQQPQPYLPPQVQTSHIQNPPVSQMKRPSVPSSPSPTTNTRTRVNDLDPERSITVMNLSNSYNGKEVAQAYSKFGKITNQNFTYNTVYLEFETSDEAENAAQARVPSSIPQSAHVRVDRGIHKQYYRMNK